MIYKFNSGQLSARLTNPITPIDPLREETEKELNEKELQKVIDEENTDYAKVVDESEISSDEIHQHEKERENANANRAEAYFAPSEGFN